jgi:pimeloyl-ACP methyl ester carboxylesterase
VAKHLKADCAYAEGRVNSGDVSLFFRRFGTPGKTPILIMHGVNYFDSFDWIEVGSRLACDREVVAFDHRGFGESGWSPSKNYSIDAKFADIRTMIEALGWRQPIILGHSGSGRLAISFAAAHSDDLSRLIVVDSGFEHAELKPTGTGNPPIVFPSVEAVMARYAKLDNPPRIALDRERAEQALVKIENGFRLKLDPDYGNIVPISGNKDVRPFRELDVWEQMEKVRCPILIVRGLRSSRWTPQIVEKIERTFPHIEWATADSMHDIAYYAPSELVAGVQKFVADT